MTNAVLRKGAVFMKNIEEYYVPWIKGQKPYVSEYCERAWQDMSLHRMMHNETPLVPSLKVLDAISKYAELANRYPDSGMVVRQKIADINSLDGPDNVLIGNGSCEVVDMIFRCLLLPGEEVIQHTPCFGIYKLRCNVLGGKLVSVPMIYKDQLEYDPDGIINAITDKTKVIVVANPNNPTGNFMDEKDFVRIAETSVPFIIDEAYVEFAGLEKSMVKLISQYKNVMILRTLSKAYGLAGLRFGYALGCEDVMGQISASRLPWNVGTIAIGAALASLEDSEALQERRDFVNSEVQFIEESLKDIPGLTIFHSHANYILFDGGKAGKKGKDLAAFALKKGILFNTPTPMYGSEGFFRVTPGTKQENRMAVEIIKEFFSS
jgi:histidinol-phosphate aminotransferase